MRANIDGNSSKIVTKAMAFDVSPDGTRLALYGAGNLADGQCAPVKAGAKGEIAVVDVATFETSTLPIGERHQPALVARRFVPRGHELPAEGCTGVGRIDVPAELGAPLVLTGRDRVFSPNAVQSETLAFGPGGLYVLARSASATDDRALRPDNSLAPVSLFAGADHWTIAEIVPTPAAMYVVATPVGAAPGKPPRSARPGCIACRAAAWCSCGPSTVPGSSRPWRRSHPPADSEAPIHGGFHGAVHG